MVLFTNPLENPMRIITIYVAQMAVAVWFAYLAYKILKRDRKRLNAIFAGFYISAAIGLIFNFIYGPIAEEGIILVLSYLTYFGVFYSPIFLVVFDLILLKSEKVITPIKQMLLFIGFGIFMFCMIFFIITPKWGVNLNESTDWSPIWHLPFFLYLAIGEALFVLIPIFYLSFRIYNKFEDEQLKQKWKFFIYGYSALIVFMYGIMISNFLASGGINVRTGMGIIGIISGISGGYLMYIGVGRQLEK
jgi:MFS family permease